jgi:hypothetical protein
LVGRGRIKPLDTTVETELGLPVTTKMHLTPSIKASFPKVQPLLVGIALLTGSFAVSAITTNFSTGFESGEGYISGAGLTGQQGWFGYWTSTNHTYDTTGGAAGNGVTNLGLSGSAQAAYVGLTPLPLNFNSTVEQVRFLNLDPIGSGQPMVNFKCQVKIVDSTISYYDYFYWRFYNQDGFFLFAVEFNNTPQRVFTVDSTNGETRFVRFTNAVEYPLNVAMNFASNRYSVTWNGLTLTNNAPITINGSVLNLGLIAAAWEVTDPTKGADNYMLFDNVSVVSSPLIPPRPQLKVLSSGGNGPATLRLTGQDGFSFAVDGATNLTAWSAIGTNIITWGKADYIDASATNKPARYYRARWVP